jgi:hypothetical protein
MSPEIKLDENDEFGQVEAVEIPVGSVEEDPYYLDPNYDESLSSVNPEEMGHE